VHVCDVGVSRGGGCGLVRVAIVSRGWMLSHEGDCWCECEYVGTRSMFGVRA
jgi:hypothetical protein